MKQIFKITLIILLASSFQHLFAQDTLSDRASLLIGKWKLTSHWVERNGKPEYAPIKGVNYIYELKEDDTYVLVDQFKTQESILNGNWRLDTLKQSIIFYNSKGNNNELGNFEAPEIHHRIYKLTSDELHIEAVYYTEEKGTSMYKRIKDK